jgi:hypothetical protein
VVPPAAGAAVRVDSAPVGEGPSVRFDTLADLESLVRDGHVQVLAQYPDRVRYALDLATERPAAREVDGATFDAWVRQGRIQALVATPELMERLRVHQEGVIYLVVLDDAVIDAVDRALAERGLSRERSILRVHAGPRVTVALARR